MPLIERRLKLPTIEPKLNNGAKPLSINYGTPEQSRINLGNERKNGKEKINEQK